MGFIKGKKAALISGGGSWGAYGGGTLERINNNYDTVIGISTGALMSPLVALKEWEYLKLAYTSIINTGVFDSYWYKPYPLTKKGKLSKFAIIMSLLWGDKSIATSKNLRRSIDKFFPESFFYELREQEKEVIVGTQNYAQQPSQIHYFNSFDETYEDFKDWMWCSANFPFYTSLVEKAWKDEQANIHIGQWSDGGLTDLVGFEHLQGHNYDEIDIILHRTKVRENYEGTEINNLMDNVTTSINAMRYAIEFDYFMQKVHTLTAKGTTVNIYWLPRKLSTNSMMFNKREMLDWWSEGYETAFDPERREVIVPLEY